MVAYASDKRFESVAGEIKIRLSSENSLSFGDCAQVLKDIDAIFRATSREVTARVSGNNAKKRDGFLVAREFRNGSLEIIADPYFAGVVTGVVANAIFSTFIYTMRRINGRPQSDEREPLNLVDKNVMREDRLKEAASKAVSATANHRKSLHDKGKIFNLSIQITYMNKTWNVTED
ncbi:hypothetical protein [Methylobacterium sp. AMS5]|uniref:hypothetical protein n=1 Tax=Methylobacterium sp. AMS5 TaxID=925818 RepID=UPI0011873E21|nr:hypothetical protein [Methylobacterium sp. AMS5]